MHVTHTANFCNHSLPYDLPEETGPRRSLPYPRITDSICLFARSYIHYMFICSQGDEAAPADSTPIVRSTVSLKERLAVRRKAGLPQTRKPRFEQASADSQGGTQRQDVAARLRRLCERPLLRYMVRYEEDGFLSLIARQLAELLAGDEALQCPRTHHQRKELSIQRSGTNSQRQAPLTKADQSGARQSRCRLFAQDWVSLENCQLGSRSNVLCL